MPPKKDELGKKSVLHTVEVSNKIPFEKAKEIAQQYIKDKKKEIS